MDTVALPSIFDVVLGTRATYIPHLAIAPASCTLYLILSIFCPLELCNFPPKPLFESLPVTFLPLTLHLFIAFSLPAHYATPFSAPSSAQLLSLSLPALLAISSVTSLGRTLRHLRDSEERGQDRDEFLR